MLDSNVKPVSLVVMGVTGTGKTTMAQELVRELGAAICRTDDFHPQANIDKMASGHPLTDGDRAPGCAAYVIGLPSRRVREPTPSSPVPH